VFLVRPVFFSGFFGWSICVDLVGLAAVWLDDDMMAVWILFFLLLVRR